MTNDYILINGKPLPTPSFGSGEQEFATVVDSGRNANGVVVGQQIGRDNVKLYCKWNYLPKEDWESVLAELRKNPMNLEVEYYDQSFGKRMIRTMYVGNRKGYPYNLDENGEPRFYVNCTLNLIDKGEF